MNWKWWRGIGQTIAKVHYIGYDSDDDEGRSENDVKILYPVQGKLCSKVYRAGPVKVTFTYQSVAPPTPINFEQEGADLGGNLTQLRSMHFR